MLNRKNYAELAKLFGCAKRETVFHDLTPSEMIGDLILELIEYLKQDNPNFDAENFHAAIEKEMKK